MSRETGPESIPRILCGQSRGAGGRAREVVCAELDQVATPEHMADMCASLPAGRWLLLQGRPTSRSAGAAGPHGRGDTQVLNTARDDPLGWLFDRRRACVGTAQDVDRYGLWL
jgi:hypothetical protein